MKIEHIAIWAKDIECLKSFYTEYFDATANEKYENSHKQFQSYFLSFTSGTRLEIMQMQSIPKSKNDCYKQFSGFIHIAISVGAEQQVDLLTAQLRRDGFEILDGPRLTGDGYYESIVLDPEGNRIEITV